MATRSRTILVLAALALVALASPAPGALADPLCDRGASAMRAWQDDADSGLDAGDAQETAILLPRDPSYSWGFVEPARHDGADLEDWYYVDVRPGFGPYTVMAEVNATLAYVLYPTELDEAYPEPLRFSIEAWQPGATAPAHVGVANVRGGANATFVVEDGGRWLFRIRVPSGLGEYVACDGPGTAADLVLPTGVVPSNYGVYFGCEPYCVRR